ncbi:hypothetical protein PPYR_10141 [Photinus pyralis]|uniref:C2H2-type domain-containing protein n=1 Tax=Photinus pyralis TaxID=7054 RepID=A0A1Y1KCH6_PHOPY|nr:protein indeterminate-domain 4, chloroplastic [Photinus pyralis]KAB0796080.1 hypothetical protein PPYR_10141 [Photinus pyralis]
MQAPNLSMARVLSPEGAVTKVFPTRDELSTVECHLPCTEEGCTKIFTSRSNLNFHLERIHQQQLMKDSSLKEYHCPDDECVFNEEKHFKSLKLLKQHYLKVHSEKQFMCEMCTKGFPTLSSRNRHTKYCGIKFKCCDCSVAYLSYESLLTHGRRKKHRVLEKTAYNPTAVQSSGQLDQNSSRKEVFIVPKFGTSLSLIVMSTLPNPTMEKSSQTEQNISSPTVKTKQTQVVKRTSQESQTLEMRRTHSSAETQTIGDCVTKKLKLSTSDVNLNRDGIVHKNIETQTKPPALNSQSCNTSFELDDDFITNPLVQKSNSCTQTSVESLYSISTATHDSIHTDTSDLNFEFMNSSSQTCFNEDMSVFHSSNYFNCNMETQTDIFDMFNYNTNSECVDCLDDDLEHYCPKDYDDIILNTIHTQTVFDDVARSVESQTVMSHTKTKSTVANTETQTDINFQKLLEEINA